MKKLLCLSASVLVLVVFVNAQTPASLQSEIKPDKKTQYDVKKEKKVDKKGLRKLIGKEVNSQSKQAFGIDFPNVTITEWSRLDNFDEATFYKDGQEISAFYDFNSKLVGTIQIKKYSDLPAKAQGYIAAHYKGYSPGDVMLYDDNGQNETDMILYNNEFADEDSYFVELSNGNKKIVVRVTMDGKVGYFTWLR